MADISTTEAVVMIILPVAITAVMMLLARIEDRNANTSFAGAGARFDRAANALKGSHRGQIR